MALGILEKDTKRKIYLSIAHGKIVHYLNSGRVENFKNVGGQLQDVFVRERSFGGQNVPFWYLQIKDGEDTYFLSISYTSGTFKSIILALASYKSLSTQTQIVIEPYEKGKYTKVVVYADGQKLDWIVKELPPIKNVIVNGKQYSDDSERMDFIRGIASQVKERLGKGSLS